jgi:putative flippase GtrA
MTVLHRFARFNLVGALGFVFQVASVDLLVDRLSIDYRIASLLALAIAIVHNFAWHVRWTWSDRVVGGASLWQAFLRFTGANGLVSVAGALALVPFFVEVTHMAPVTANVAAIAACGVVNFWLAGWWCFRATGNSRTGARRRNHLRATP